MSQPDQDSQNNNQQCQPSKLPKPSSLDHYFHKIEANPKLWQFQAKIKPNPYDKKTKITYKTNYNQLYGLGWLYNSKLKFETKEGKTKITLNTKLFEKDFKSQRDLRNKNKQRINGQIQDRQPRVDKEGEVDKKNEEGSKRKDKQNGDFDLNISTSYDNSKVNIKLKQKGQINIKYNQTCEIIPNNLKAQIEYQWQYRNQAEVNKYSLQFLYTTGVKKWCDQIINLNNQQLPKFNFHKNETKLKAKFSTHSDTQFKINSINHFGAAKQIIQNQNQTNQKKRKSKQNSEGEDNQNQSQQNLEIKQNTSNQTLKAKLQLESKLSLSKKAENQFNFKTYVNLQSILYKQSVKAQTLINQLGFHNFELKYLNKYFQSYAFGWTLGTNWNSHSSSWQKKWEIIVEKTGIQSIGNVAASISDKCFGFRVIRKTARKGKVELMVSKKWGTDFKEAPNIGVKININW